MGERVKGINSEKVSTKEIISKEMFCIGGMGLMSVAKPMIQNVFTDAMPALGINLTCSCMRGLHCNLDFTGTHVLSFIRQLKNFELYAFINP